MAKTQAVETETTTEAEPSLADQLLTALQDPEAGPTLGTAMVKAASQTAEGRALLDLPAGRGEPLGEYRRNYRGEAALRVHGGVEVEHQAGFVPLPPSWITMYEGAEGSTTDDIELAARDADGSPMKTLEYRHWIDLQMEGRHLEGDVRSDMAAGKFKLPDAVEVEESMGV
jgi:hypothetical protein